MLASTRGDTVTLQPLLGVRRVSPSGSCTPMSKATLVVVPQSTRVSVPRFSGSKTALSVIGGAVLIGGLGFFYMLSTDKTADGRPGPATPR
ncbi:MAG: hypothetical protein HOQ09_06665 [Gemmatimonadaceae bacterium]|nr:hypothetical protein [Gemmatimonadaceae bacterium]